MSYEDFLKSKDLNIGSVGLDVEKDELHDTLFGFQRDIVKWALKRGKAAMLKSSYYKVACKNLEKAILERSQIDLFDVINE